MLGDRILRELHGDPSADAVAARVAGVRREHAESLADLEGRLWADAFRTANRLYYAVMSGRVILVSYFYVRRNELRNLTGVVESVHYGRPFRPLADDEIADG